MNRFGMLRLFSAIVVGLVCGVGQVSAQARQVVASQAVSMPPPPQPLYDDRQDARDPNPMAFAGVGLKLGMAGMSAGQLKLSRSGKSYTGNIDSRRGLHLAVPINLGGDGFGWTLEPYLTRTTISRTVVDATGNLSNGADTNLTAYGLYTGPAINLHVAAPLYLGFGAGLKAAYVSSPDFKLALDAYGRIPLNATYYLSNQLALVAETGFGYGVSAYTNKAQTTTNPSTGKVTRVKNDSQLGRAFAWDCSIGVRLP